LSLEQIRSRLYARRQELLDLKVLVLAGGASSEREISLRSGQSLVASLAEQGFSASLAVISERGLALDYFQSLGPSRQLDLSPRRVETKQSIEQLRGHDLIFTMMHGSLGENGTWQGLLRLLGLPFVSADVKGSALAMDKVLSKRIAMSLGIRTPQWWSGAALQDLRSCIPDSIGRLVAKPLDQGSSVGVAIFDNNESGWAEALGICAGIPDMMVEQYIHGRELTSGWIGLQVEAIGLPIVEIRPAAGFYDYRAKYTKGASEYLCPAPLDAAISAATMADAGLIYRELQLEPFARMDFILDEEGNHWFLEANTLPGFTELSLLPMAAAAIGVSYGELLEILMLCAIERTEREGSRP
jgi:D-alanine--D-alanine ligase